MAHQAADAVDVHIRDILKWIWALISPKVSLLRAIIAALILPAILLFTLLHVASANREPISWKETTLSQNVTPVHIPLITSSLPFTNYFPIIIKNHPLNWRSLGLSDLPIKQIIVTRDIPATIYAVIDLTQNLTATKIYKSSNNGQFWAPSSNGISGRVQSLFVHSVTPTLLLAGTLTGGDGVHRSNDGGAHWEPAGLDPLIRVVAIHPSTSTLWLAASYYPLIFGSAYIYRTDNAGIAWTQVTTFTTVVNNFVFDYKNLNRVYACTTGGVISSNDTGLTWPDTALTTCSDLTLHTYNNNILYAASGVNLLKTENMGLSWAPIFTATQHIKAVDLDPINPNLVYAATWDVLFSSRDAGYSWQEIPLPQNLYLLHINGLAVDFSGTLFIGTDHGVWSIRDN
jgi:photosystem II stability/assembly factor-like uncharacterized protein